MKPSRPHATPEEAEPLIKMVNMFHPTFKGLEQFIIEHSFPIRIRKGKILLSSGTIATHIYFVKKGILRGFVNDDDREITTWITAENELVSSIGSFTMQMPTLENIQAIEDCELLQMTFTDLEKIYKKFPSFNITARKIYELYYVSAESRAFIARLKNAEQKYQYFLVQNGHLANRIALKYIASYLGINMETLSRLRSKKELSEIKHAASAVYPFPGQELL